MDPRLSEIIKKDLPEINRDVTDGYAFKAMKEALSYIEDVWKSAMAPMIDYDIKYEGMQRCTPKEVFDFAPLGSAKNRRYLEIEKSDMFLVKFFISLREEMMRPIYMYIPYCRVGGLLYIKGSLFAISPVLIDNTLSVGEGQIFISVGKDRFSFLRHQYHVRINGRVKAEYVVYSDIHHSTNKKSGRQSPYYHVNINATPVLYLLCKFGLSGLFNKYFKIRVTVGDDTTITEKQYPKEKYTIFSSVGTRPANFSNLRKPPVYHPCKIRFAVKNEHVTPRLVSVITGIYYVLDCFAELATLEELDNVNLWRLILGHIVHKNDDPASKLISSMDYHIASIDTYIDERVRERLHHDGVNVNDIYDLFIYMIDNLPSIVSSKAKRLQCLYGKRLEVLDYALKEIVQAIFNFRFHLHPNQDGIVTKETIEKAILRNLNPRLCREINAGNAFASSVSSASDNMFFRITNVMIHQMSTVIKSHKKWATEIRPDKRLDASIAEVADWSRIPKSSPSGYERINPFVKTDSLGVVIRKKKYIELLDKTQQLIQR